ncbi:hypothetical protein GGI12_000354 [Dipsacomyces acuminosporus]|nr:hypothetical protein GGI12_000354 [Dipsacomyces acuminosporus]
MGSADIDSRSDIDLLLVIGPTSTASSNWTAILSKLSLTAAKVFVVAEPDSLSNGIAYTQQAAAVQCDPETFGSRWSEAATAADQVVPGDPHDNRGDATDGSTSLDAEYPALSCGDVASLSVADLILVESSSTLESSDEISRSQSSMSTTNSSAKKHSKGSKGRSREKVNLNHLLNFTLPVRMPSPLPVMRPRRRVVDSVASARQAQINKRTFINANFRFALKPKFWSNFMPIATRPDMQLKWEWIERVIMPVAGEIVSCPICLSPPVAARVTKCGHVFCFPCVLRFLAMESEKEPDTKKCPICWEPITGDELLPANFWTARYQNDLADRAAGAAARRSGSNDSSKDESSSLRSDMHITMRLMKRLRGSTICLPRATMSQLFADGLSAHTKAKDDGDGDGDGASGGDGKPNAKLTFESYQFPWTFTEDALPFAKFMLADHEYCRKEYERELLELDCEREDAASDAESQVFVESAIMQVEFAIKSIQSAQGALQQIEDRARTRQTHRQAPEEAHRQPEAKDPHAQSQGVRLQGSAAKHSADPAAGDAHADDFYHIYQADDGQHIYMHPLHMRVLSHEYGGYASLPDQLEIKLRHLVESTITDEVRHRFRFIDHLSLRCDVVFVEPELKGLVSSKSLQHFQSQLSHREKQHAARAKYAALDEARSEAMAAAAAAAAAAESASNGGIRYRNEWTRNGQDRYGEFLPTAAYSGVKPDESNFPALEGSSTPQSGTGSALAEDGHGPGTPARSEQSQKSLWPRQPLPQSAAGEMYDSVWSEFERSAAAGRYDDEHEVDYCDDDDEYYYHIHAKQGLDAKPSQVKIQSSRPKKEKGRVKLALTGTSARRRR